MSKLNTRDLLFPAPHNENPRDVTKVQIGAVVDMLGDEWKLKREDTLGALVLSTMFEDHVDQASSISRSWNGDRIQLWEDEEGGFALLGRVEFETAEAAKLLETELVELCRKKWMRGKTIQELESEGTHLEADVNHSGFRAAREQRGVLPQQRLQDRCCGYLGTLGKQRRIAVPRTEVTTSKGNEWYVKANALSGDAKSRCTFK